MKHIFIIGSKGIPAAYGGFETFVDKLTEKRKSKAISYHVACLGDVDKEFECNGSRCFMVKTRNIGSARAVLYDIKALKRVCDYIEREKIKGSIIYILACRIGPFLKLYSRRLKRLQIKLYLNPDGQEWNRKRWNRGIRAYWKLSERLMVKEADLIICDSLAIEKYIRSEYKGCKVNTTYISYGAELKRLDDKTSEALEEWYKDFEIIQGNYYLLVGRFVPENNYALIINEYMKSHSNKDLVIISNVEKNKFYKKLLKETSFLKDKRIKFVGTVYDSKLLQEIRARAYGYIHGHEVGGTNPSLLEALASTRINFLLDVPFNREVAEEGALYFKKGKGSLSALIDKGEYLEEEEINTLEHRAKGRITDNYNWDKISVEYEELFINEV